MEANLVANLVALCGGDSWYCSQALECITTIAELPTKTFVKSK